jgi:hypothetical protein
VRTNARPPTASFHDRRLARQLEDPEFRAEYKKAKRQIAAIDAIVNGLDSLRAEHGVTKAELAREIGKNPASVRRLFTAPANADALDADVVILPRTRRRRHGRPPQPARKPPAR